MSKAKRSESSNPPAGQRVTARDIARVAGVSQATVSLALRGSAEISESRIAQIRNLADKMNYHPRAAAQLLRSRRSGQIGVVVGSSDAVHAFSRGFTGPLLGSFVDVCLEHQLRYIIEFHAHDQQSATHAPYQVTSGLTDGSVLIGDVGDAVREYLSREHPQFPWISVDEPSRFCVLTDSRRGIADIVRKLVGFGHQRLAYACGPQRYYTHKEGFAGWEQAIRAHGLQIPDGRTFIFGGGEEQGIRAFESIDWIRGLLRRSDRPTAFICHDMVIARAVIHVAAECGLSVPKDLSVTSWGWHVAAQEQYPPLTTIELDYRAMIEQGVQLLMRLVNEDPITEMKVLLAPKCIDGGTVGPPPATPKSSKR